MNNNVEKFLKVFKIKTNNIDLYERAFTHSSYNSDAKTTHVDYERLEFMGDSIIGFVVADLVFSIYPNLSQGEMTKLRSSLVQTKNLAKLGKKLKLHEYIIVGNSLRNNDISNMLHLIEDVFEAIIGAIYIDQGFKKTYGILKNIFFNEVKNFKFSMIQDYKSKLQEDIQAENRETVDYIVVNETGPVHSKTFEVEVKLDGIILGRGSGKTKKEAEQNAAKDALSKRV